ncbi:hypothetical protein V6N11_081240 [Hibiscus sabdariffa]|uniref:Reverse transcriptase zinc-binding domain-containing protein n=1 Tax=Hibiscus sabdariffa TaxID=183260 RepID=A0ABR2QJ90_9ROSI
MATTNGSMEKDIWRLVWSKLAPPKVEAFLWKTIKGRLPVGTELLKHNINVPWSGKCILCSREAETVSHLLCHCHVASKVWKKWCEVWNICLVMPGDLSGFLRWWNSQPKFPSLKAVWKMIFYETIWTICRCRNEALFNAKYCNEFRSIFGVAWFILGMAMDSGHCPRLPSTKQSIYALHKNAYVQELEFERGGGCFSGSTYCLTS